MLQLSDSRDTFDKASKLFFKKWNKYSDFVQYFNYEWLEFLTGWYEGYSNVSFTPSTNNNLESTNRYIKDINTLRNRLSLQEFLVKAFEIVKNWSLDQINIHEKI